MPRESSISHSDDFLWIPDARSELSHAQVSLMAPSASEHSTVSSALEQKFHVRGPLSRLKLAYNLFKEEAP